MRFLCAYRNSSHLRTRNRKGNCNDHNDSHDDNNDEDDDVINLIKAIAQLIEIDRIMLITRT